MPPHYENFVFQLFLLGIFSLTGLGYNLHTINLTHLNCRIRWILVHSQICTIIATVLGCFYHSKYAHIN